MTNLLVALIIIPDKLIITIKMDAELVTVNQVPLVAPITMTVLVEEPAVVSSPLAAIPTITTVAVTKLGALTTMVKVTPVTTIRVAPELVAAVQTLAGTPVITTLKAT
jgi:hypothetical protein